MVIPWYFCWWCVLVISVIGLRGSLIDSARLTEACDTVPVSLINKCGSVLGSHRRIFDIQIWAADAINGVFWRVYWPLKFTATPETMKKEGGGAADSLMTFRIWGHGVPVGAELLSEPRGGAGPFIQCLRLKMGCYCEEEKTAAASDAAVRLIWLRHTNTKAFKGTHALEFELM